MKVKYIKNGVCPLCGSTDIEYFGTEIDEGGAYYEAHCNACEADWNECFDLVFAGVWRIYDKDGNEYEDAPLKKEG